MWVVLHARPGEGNQESGQVGQKWRGPEQNTCIQVVSGISGVAGTLMLVKQHIIWCCPRRMQPRHNIILETTEANSNNSTYTGARKARLHTNITILEVPVAVFENSH